MVSEKQQQMNDKDVCCYTLTRFLMQVNNTTLQNT